MVESRVGRERGYSHVRFVIVEVVKRKVGLGILISVSIENGAPKFVRSETPEKAPLHSGKIEPIRMPLGLSGHN